MYSLPLYEAKYSDKGEWKEISEVELMEGLNQVFEKVTPAIQDMIEGKEINTPVAVFRMKIKGGDPSGPPAV